MISEIFFSTSRDFLGTERWTCILANSERVPNRNNHWISPEELYLGQMFIDKGHILVNSFKCKWPKKINQPKKLLRYSFNSMSLLNDKGSHHNLPDDVRKLSQKFLPLFLGKTCGRDLQGVLNNRVRHVRRIEFNTAKKWNEISTVYKIKKHTYQTCKPTTYVFKPSLACAWWFGFGLDPVYTNDTATWSKLLKNYHLIFLPNTVLYIYETTKHKKGNCDTILLYSNKQNLFWGLQKNLAEIFSVCQNNYIG